MSEIISGLEATEFLNHQINQHQSRIAQVLASFDPGSTFSAWIDTVRAIEEFINLPLFALDGDDEVAEAIVNFRLDGPDLDQTALANIQDRLIVRFNEGVARRFVYTLVQAAAIRTAFLLHGLVDAAAGLQTVQHAVGYFQSRRRHLVTLLYMLPKSCRGARPTTRLGTLNLLLPLVELHGVPLVGLYRQLMLAKVFPDYKLTIDHNGFAANHDFELLDSLFLEPERAGITEMNKALSDPKIVQTLECVDSRLIFSAAELRNDIRLIQGAYAEFGLESSNFAPAASLAQQLLAFCKDDYLIELPADRFEKLVEGVGLSLSKRRLFVYSGSDYIASTNVFAPFIDVGGLYVSTVPLLSRFLYYWKTVCLNHKRRFQIRSGFIFEESVKDALTKQGFTITNIKRINHKEFDVVAVLGQVIYNVQCKNNLVDISQLESDCERFARYNRHLDRYYARALAKEEEAREQLLKEKVGLYEIRHVVVSRFPVASNNLRVIPFRRIESFRATFSDDASS